MAKSCKCYILKMRAEKLEAVAKERRSKSKAKENAFKSGSRPKPAGDSSEPAKKKPVIKADIKPKNAATSAEGACYVLCLVW